MKTAKHTATYRFLTILFLLLCGIFFARPCKAEVTYENPDTSYVVSIEDEADLLSDEEESRLSTQMEEITAYGNVAFVSLDTNYTSTDSYAREHYRQLFGSDSGTLFVIDMDNRNIWIHSNGAIYRTSQKVMRIRSRIMFIPTRPHRTTTAARPKRIHRWQLCWPVVVSPSL